MNFIVCIILCFCVGICFSKDLRTKRQNKNCNCILLRDCNYYLMKLRNRNPDVRKEIQENVCGNAGIRLQVCCPPENSSLHKDFFPSDCGMNINGFKVINGNETEMGEFPWAVALEYKKKNESYSIIRCAGSVINARYVLTAAHCLDPVKLEGYELHSIRLGEWNLITRPDCMEVESKPVCAPNYISAKPEKIIKHKMYNVEHPNANDIALIRLNQTINFDEAEGYILPICLPSFGIRTELLKRESDPIVVGWGKTLFREQSSILLKAELQFAENKRCVDRFYSSFGPKQLCIGGGSKDSCMGDSGGPLMLKGPEGKIYLQIGIVSFGTLICGIHGVPAVYTSVSHYKDWISYNMEPW